MNPLIVLFWISLIINDYFFKDAYFCKYYFYGSFFYWIFYYFQPKDQFFNSASRKLLLASYSQSYDPSMYCKIKLDTKNAKIFLQNYETKTGKKVSWALFLVKCLSQVLKKYPECNLTIKNGLHQSRGSIDICILVNVGGGKVI